MSLFAFFDIVVKHFTLFYGQDTKTLTLSNGYFAFLNIVFFYNIYILSYTVSECFLKVSTLIYNSFAFTNIFFATFCPEILVSIVPLLFPLRSIVTVCHFSFAFFVVFITNFFLVTCVPMF